MILEWNPLKNEILKGFNRYFPKDAHQKSEGGVSEVRCKKTRLLHLGNVEELPHPQCSAQRAPEGLNLDETYSARRKGTNASIVNLSIQVFVGDFINRFKVRHS